MQLQIQNNNCNYSLQFPQPTKSEITATEMKFRRFIEKVYRHYSTVLGRMSHCNRHIWFLHCMLNYVEQYMLYSWESEAISRCLLLVCE